MDHETQQGIKFFIKIIFWVFIIWLIFRDKENQGKQSPHRQPENTNNSPWTHKGDDKPEAPASQLNTKEVEGFLNKHIPEEIRRSMLNFKQGKFKGQDRSPLAYVGYRVGKTNGLEAWDRKRRLEVCLRVPLPKALADEYRHWGGPATQRRFYAICNHLKSLAKLRRGRQNYERAVAEWEADHQWFRATFKELSRSFKQS